MKQDQFLNLILPLQPRMQLVAEHLLVSATEAEDAVQDVVASLWERRAELDRILNKEGYTMNFLRNHCVTILRHRQPTVDVESLVEYSNDDAAREAALNEERAAKLDQMMERLPEVQRQAVQMRYIEQLSHEEMQQRLKMSSSNVYTTLSRAISALKTMSHGR
ncbi:MAG: sigma-70 family RNA polymerase sigma factor [Bacteroidales bacterium]|nr:sigma-70 family RNA polymerase sigma factor [Bacteroidales bacterium]MBR4229869.1 sigma-70 family RNA polymerase sigma factor [Bacteroidales bacterium]